MDFDCFNLLRFFHCGLVSTHLFEHQFYLFGTILFKFNAILLHIIFFRNLHKYSFCSIKNHKFILIVIIFDSAPSGYSMNEKLLHRSQIKLRGPTHY